MHRHQRPEQAIEIADRLHAREEQFRIAQARRAAERFSEYGGR